jgi:hypothetical protein
LYSRLGFEKGRLSQYLLSNFFLTFFIESGLRNPSRTSSSTASRSSANYQTVHREAGVRTAVQNRTPGDIGSAHYEENIMLTVAGVLDELGCTSEDPAV